MNSGQLIFLCAFLLSSVSVHSQTNSPKGTIKGRVFDAESMLPLPGAHVSLHERKGGTATDDKGQFELPDLPVGNYSVACSSIGYGAVVKTDVIVRSERITFVTIAMEASVIELSGETVTSGYFAEMQTQPLSNITFSSEEIRRAPGSAGDVSRILFGLPSLAKVNDTKNSLIVRGGSPVENGFYVDNIEIPNINHFPVQGSTEGPIGILNIDFVEDVTFHSGAFSANFGDKLSSVMDITYREGNRTARALQVDLSMQGFGGALEGPLDGGRGSYMISARRSFLDLILDLMNEKVGLPIYSDVQGKVAYDLSEHHRISILDVFSIDTQTMNQENALDSKLNIYPRYDYLANTGGVNWQWIWGSSGFSNTSIAHTYARTAADYYQTRTDRQLLANSSIEQEWKLRNSNHWLLGDRNRLSFGFDVKYGAMKYDQSYSDYQDLLGQATDPLLLQKSVNGVQAGAFVEFDWGLSRRFTFSPACRVDRSWIREDFTLSPRMALTYHIDESSSLTGSYGRYYQNIPLIIAVQNENFKHLSMPRADHYVLSYSRLLDESVKLTLEVYDKEYSHFPMDPTQPNLFLFDQAVTEGIFLNHANLLSGGIARSRGIEVTVQKKLAREIYGLLSGAYYRAQYKGLDGNWYNRAYDNKFNVAIEGGYKPDGEWEFSLRWLYAGGVPYTPFDEQASSASHKGVYDATRINALRLPDFHSLNVRADRRFHFQSSTLVVYLSIWNAYGRRNVAAYTWNEIDDKIAEETMWGTLPVFGVEYEF